MAPKKNIRNRLGWTPEERRNPSDRSQSNKKEIISLVIPVLVYRRRLTATLNTLGQFSKISQELASFVITKGATFQEAVYKYNEITKTMSTVFVPIATNKGSIVSIKCLVDRGLTRCSMVLGMPAIRKLGYQVRVGNVAARTHIRTTNRNIGAHLRQIDREQLSSRSRSKPERRRVFRSESERRRGFRSESDGGRRVIRSESDRQWRVFRRKSERESTRRTQREPSRYNERHSSHRTGGTRYEEIHEDVVEGLSREQMDEIQSWG